MSCYIIAAAAIVLLGVLLYGEKRDSVRWKLASKPLLSALFILTAVLGQWSVPSLSGWVLAGLILSWAGDCFLIFTDKRRFLFGLVAFLLGHVSYTIGFYLHGSLRIWSVLALLLLAGLGIMVFRWLRPHLGLGTMSKAVIAYIAVISLMVSGAAALFADARWDIMGRAAVMIGAVLFFVSDIFVARNQFVVDEFRNRCIGLPLYYAGQFLIALSISLI